MSLHATPRRYSTTKGLSTAPPPRMATAGFPDGPLGRDPSGKTLRGKPHGSMEIASSVAENHRVDRRDNVAGKRRPRVGTRGPELRPLSMPDIPLPEAPAFVKPSSRTAATDLLNRNFPFSHGLRRTDASSTLPDPRGSSAEAYPNGPVAQLGERFHGMEEVVGSSPIRSTRRAPRFSRTLARSCGALHLVSTLPKVPPDDHIYPIKTRRTRCLHRTGKLGRRRSTVSSPSMVLDCGNTGYSSQPIVSTRLTSGRRVAARRSQYLQRKPHYEAKL